MGNVCGAPRQENDSKSGKLMKEERSNKKEEPKTPLAKMDLDKKRDSSRNTLSELNNEQIVPTKT
jgi:hypothetical protein